MKFIPSFEFEEKTGFNLVAGVDEVGRGPLCGPVIASAVIFTDRKIEIPVKIRDSKQLSEKDREKAYNWIIQNTVWAIGEAGVQEIDDLNILNASFLAMKRAIDSLKIKPEFSLVDGNKIPKDIQGYAIVKGDSKSISIASASIIAKCTRDKIMKDLSIYYPKYNWNKNMGYPTKFHLDSISKYGINEHYRKTFKPVRDLLNKNYKI